MIDTTVCNPKQWAELMSLCPGVEAQPSTVAQNGYVNAQYNVNISKPSHLQLRVVNPLVTIDSLQKPLNDMICLPPVDNILCILQKCRKEKDLAHARHIHVFICDTGLNTQSMLECHFVPMFVECGNIDDAQHVFNRLVVRDEYSWRSLIQGYISIEETDCAFILFERMQEDCLDPSKFMFIILLKACAKYTSDSKARRIHYEIAKEGYEDDIFVASSLVDTYVKVGALVDACEVFNDLRVRDVVSWTTLMDGYADFGFFEEALDCYEKMQAEGVRSDRVAYICSMKSCSGLRLLERGTAIHNEVVKEGIDTDVSVLSAIVGMYAKCGWMSEARDLFETLSIRCVALWNALFAGYSEYGHGEEAMKCLEDMRSHGISPDDFTFLCCLKACVSARAWQMGIELHSQIVKHGCENQNFVGSNLVDAYIKCGLLNEARKTFEGLVGKDVVSWTSLVAGYVEYDLFEEALSCTEQMQIEGISPDACTFSCILNGCASARAVEQGLHTHAEIIKRGMDSSSLISGTLIKLYAELGLFTEARSLFSKLLVKNDILFNSLIGGFVEYGCAEDALYYMDIMPTDGVCMNDSIFRNGLKACGILYALEKGFELHSQITKVGLDADSLLGNDLLDMYCKCGFLLEARAIFDRMQVQTIASWTALLAGYVEYGHGEEVLECMELMQASRVSMDMVAYICSLKACCCIGTLNQGQEMHCRIVVEGLEEDSFVGSMLVDMYAKCGSLSEAEEVLDELPVRNVVLWTGIIAAYVEQGCAEDALSCFSQMQSENVTANAITYAAVLKACKIAKSLKKSRQTHSEIIKLGMDEGISVCGSLVDLYASCGLLIEAKEVFDRLETRDLSTWNVLIEGYSEYGQDEQVLHCLQEMQLEGTSPDGVTYIYGLRACYPKAAITLGQKIYSDIVKKGLESKPFVSSCVVDMHIKHQAYSEAHKLFDRLSVRDTISWNSIIVGYSDRGLSHEALRCLEQMQVEGTFPDVITWNAVLLGCAEHGKSEMTLVMYSQMLEQGVMPDTVTFLSAIKACGNASALDLGNKLFACYWHGDVSEETERLIIATALVEMFGNCGSLANAQQVFDAMQQKDTTIWNALMRGYSCQGEGKQALYLFDRMIEEGAHPDSITFLCILVICNHEGLLVKGHEYFESMSKVYGISPSIKHLNCMIDLLGRAGHLDDALLLLKQIRFEPNLSIINTLLCACQKWGNVGIGKNVFDYAVRVKEKHGGMFVLMSNIYADDSHTREHVRSIDSMRHARARAGRMQSSVVKVDKSCTAFNARKRV